MTDETTQQTEQPTVQAEEKVKCFFCRAEHPVSKNIIVLSKTRMGFSALMCPPCKRANEPVDALAALMTDELAPLTQAAFIPVPETGEPVITAEDVEELREDPQSDAAKKIMANIFCRSEELFKDLTGAAAINACTSRIIFLEQIQAAIRAEIYVSRLVKSKKTREAERGEQMSAVEFESKMRKRRLTPTDPSAPKPARQTRQAKPSKADHEVRARELFKTDRARKTFIIMMKANLMTEQEVINKINDLGMDK